MHREKCVTSSSAKMRVRKSVGMEIATIEVAKKRGGAKVTLSRGNEIFLRFSLVLLLPPLILAEIQKSENHGK